MKWPLCYLFFFDIRILIAPLVPSNSSCNDNLEARTNNQRVFNKHFSVVTYVCLLKCRMPAFQFYLHISLHKEDPIRLHFCDSPWY